jgi:hypothetical protein
MFKYRSRQLSQGSQQRRHFSPLMLFGLSVPVVLTLIAAGGSIFPHLRIRAAALNMDCTLIVPANPLSAQGLATPYQLVGNNAKANGPCKEMNNAQAAFVQGAVLDPATGQISVYNPLVVDQGTQPAVAPVTPQLPARAIVALWFGFNGNTLTLQDSNGSLAQGRCVNGIRGSIFGQFAYCNAPAFFAAANLLMRTGKLAPPALGTAKDGQPCPTVRDFSVVDMDQSDNVTTTYLVTVGGRVAQDTAANRGALGKIPTAKNASDNRLLAVALDTALSCTPWMAPDLADPGNRVPALPLNELQAAAHQAAPVALVPSGDPMVLVNGQQNLFKVNAYRLGVDQRLAPFASASTTTYCTNLLNVAPARLQLDKGKALTTVQGSSPDPMVANSLFTFLAQRFVATFEANGLNCAGLLNQKDPVTVTTQGGVAVDATITVPTGTGGTGTNGTTPTKGIAMPMSGTGTSTTVAGQ